MIILLVNTIEHHGNRLIDFMSLKTKILTGCWEKGVGVDTLYTVMTNRAPVVIRNIIFQR